MYTVGLGTQHRILEFNETLYQNHLFGNVMLNSSTLSSIMFVFGDVKGNVFYYSIIYRPTVTLYVYLVVYLWSSPKRDTQLKTPFILASRAIQQTALKHVKTPLILLSALRVFVD